MNKSKQTDTTGKRRVLIVDDHPMTRQGIMTLIAATPDLEVCGEAETANQALDKTIELKPHLVLADITMPGKNGLELLKDLRALRPELPVLMLSMHDERLYAERVLRAGGRGYIMKQEGGKKILDAIYQVLEGKIFLSEAMASEILENLSSRPKRTSHSPVERLTDREFEVFQLIGQGQSTRTIAAHLHLSAKTIEVHRLKIKGKLKLKTAAELIRYAVRWVESDTP